MAVMVPREKWTDERLDYLNQKVDDGFADLRAEMRAGFARVDGELKDLRQEMNARFSSVDTRFTSIDARFNSVDARFTSIDARFNSIDDRFDALNRNLLVAAAAIIAALIGVNVF